MIPGEKISYTDCIVVKRLPAIAKIVTIGRQPMIVIPINIGNETPLRAAKILIHNVGITEEK